MGSTREAQELYKHVFTYVYYICLHYGLVLYCNIFIVSDFNRVASIIFKVIEKKQNSSRAQKISHINTNIGI